MNKRFSIVLTIATVILIGLILTLSLLRTTSQKKPLEVDPLVTPTGISVNRDGDNISATQIAVAKSNLSNEQRSTLQSFEQFVPYETDSLILSYSNLTNKIYIEKKNDKADIELQEFLERNGLTELYSQYPELFKIVKTNIYEEMSEEEEVLTEIDLQSNIPSTTPYPTLRYDQQRRQNQTSSFNILVKNLMSFRIPEKSSRDKLVLSLSRNENATIESGTGSNSSPEGAPSLPSKPVEGAQIGSYKMRVKYDWKKEIDPVCILQPGTSSLVSYLKRTFGSLASYGISANCKNIPSMHSEGRAVDYFFQANNPSQLKTGNEAFAWLLTNAQNVGIQYIKFWRVHWSPTTGIHCVDNTINKNDMYAHSNHIHFELNLAGAHKETPFFTKGISAPAAMKINQDICPLLDSRMR